MNWIILFNNDTIIDKGSSIKGRKVDKIKFYITANKKENEGKQSSKFKKSKEEKKRQKQKQGQRQGEPG